MCNSYSAILLHPQMHFPNKHLFVCFLILYGPRVQVSYCDSVLRSRDSLVQCNRKTFFCRERSLTRKFSARRSFTGLWSITVNLPPLQTADSISTDDERDSGRKSCDKTKEMMHKTADNRSTGCNRW